jgi:hypothetical protein
MLTAIYHHMRTGEGQYIDAAMIEGHANFLGEMVMGNLINGTVGERMGNRDAIMSPHGCYPCKVTKDEAEWVTIAVSNQKEWKALCKAMGNPAWTEKVEFGDELSRWKNQEELDKQLSLWTRQSGAYEVADVLQKAGVTAAASLSTKQLTHDKHMEARDFFKRTSHAVLGNVLLTGLPFRFSDSPEVIMGLPAGPAHDYVFGNLLGLLKMRFKADRGKSTVLRCSYMAQPSYSRQVDFERIFNFRDLGGYQSQDGRKVVWRRVFRSAEIRRMTRLDVVRMKEELSLTSIVDLRSQAELEKHGVGLVNEYGFQYHNVPFVINEVERNTGPERFLQFSNMGEVYLYFVRHPEYGRHIVEALEILPDRKHPGIPLRSWERPHRHFTAILFSVLISLIGLLLRLH